MPVWSRHQCCITYIDLGFPHEQQQALIRLRIPTCGSSGIATSVLLRTITVGSATLMPTLIPLLTTTFASVANNISGSIMDNHLRALRAWSEKEFSRKIDRGCLMEYLSTKPSTAYAKYCLCAPAPAYSYCCPRVAYTLPPGQGAIQNNRTNTGDTCMGPKVRMETRKGHSKAKVLKTKVEANQTKC